MRGRLGAVHSVDSMSTHDGPGIRSVVYFQGCPLRCVYCHNPDTWELKASDQKMGVSEVIARVKRYRPFFDRSGGGVTLSGGEPLMQPEFLIDLLRACKGAGIHTAIETSGFGLEPYGHDQGRVFARLILDLVDLVILDVKDPGQVPTAFIQELAKGKALEGDPVGDQVGNPKGLWIRYVRVPGLTDSSDYHERVVDFSKTLGYVEKIEPLMYHTMGVYKYEALGIEYALG